VVSAAADDFLEDLGKDKTLLKDERFEGEAVSAMMDSESEDVCVWFLGYVLGN